MSLLLEQTSAAETVPAAGRPVERDKTTTQMLYACIVKIKSIPQVLCYIFIFFLIFLFAPLQIQINKLFIVSRVAASLLLHMSSVA